MNEALQKELLARLDVMAAKLGVAAGEVWRILVKQAAVTGVTKVASALLLAIAALVVFRRAKKFWANVVTKDSEFGFPGVLFFGISAILWIISASCLLDAITPLLNSEYFALHELLTSLVSK